MARKVSEDLFNLIKSLHRTEKRYFKVFSKRHTIGEKNNYVSLFDAIDHLKIYDEKKLLRENSFIHPRLFPDQKNHLYQQVLRSLVAYSSDKKTESKLRFLLGCYDILHKKGLHTQCRKIIFKAKEIAKRLEKKMIYIECLEREKNLELILFDLKKSPLKIKKINSEIEKTIEQYRVDHAYNVLSEEMYFILSEESFIRSDKNKNRSKKIFRHPLMKKKPAGGSFISQYNFHRIHSLHAYSHTNFRAFYLHCREMVTMIENFPAILADSPKTYIVALQNLLIAQKNLRLFDELFKTLHKLKEVESSSQDTSALIFAISSDIELSLYIDTGQFEKGTLLTRSITKGLAEFGEHVSVPHEILFYFNLAYNFVGCGNYKQALPWLNKVINHPKSRGAVPNIYHMANLVSMLVHYELGNTDLLDYKVHSISKTLGKKDALHELENILFTFFSKAIIVNEGKLKRQLFTALHHDLEKLHSDPEKRRAFTTFDFLSWVKSKVTGKSMSEIVKKRPPF